MKTLASILFILLLKVVSGQNNFYLDFQLNEKDLSYFKLVEKEKRNNSDNFIFYDKLVPLTSEEVKEKLLKLKSKDSKLSNKIRLYLRINNSYDSLRIMSFAAHYINSDNKSEVGLDISLSNLESIMKSQDCIRVLEILHKKIQYHLRSDTSVFYSNIEFENSELYSYLKPSFYLLTCPELYLYSKPLDKNSLFEDRWYPHELISNSLNIQLSYFNFPLPNKIRYAITSRIIEDKIDIDLMTINTDWESYSNKIVLLEIQQIGLHFNLNDTDKTFWIDYNNYLTERNESLSASFKVFYLSAISKYFRPL